MTNDKTPTSDAAREMPELLPCPFCGAKAELLFAKYSHCTAQCENCSCSKSAQYVDDAKKNWNTRTPSPECVDVEELKNEAVYQAQIGNGGKEITFGMFIKAIENTVDLVLRTKSTMETGG